MTSPSPDQGVVSQSASSTPAAAVRQLVLGSRNQKKSAEIRRLLEPYGIEVVSVADFPDAAEVEETGSTFGENACLKASEVARQLQAWTLAEDSGLMVDALEGRPGIYSARFSGPDATDEQNNARLIEELAGVPAEKRKARYVCHVALAAPDGSIQLQEEATCSGRIAEQARGTGGFGYDPYFLLPEYHRTFGELSPLVKQQLSHRARAFARALPHLVRILTEAGLRAAE